MSEKRRRPLAVVTGANTGIGFHVAGQLASRHGYHVILACRSLPRAEAALEAMRQQYGEVSAEIQVLDLASFSSVRSCASSIASRHGSLDLLVCNAGLNAASVPQGSEGQLTEDGVDVVYQTNFLAHLLLVALLLTPLQSAEGRVVSVTSVIHRSVSPVDFELARTIREPYVSLYGLSKLAQILAGLELHRRYGSSSAERVAFHSVNPGGVASDIWREYPAWQRWAFRAMLASSERAANTVVAACVCDEGKLPARPMYWNGYFGASRSSAFEYWSPVPAGSSLVPSRPSDEACDRQLAQQLWDHSMAIFRKAGFDVNAMEEDSSSYDAWRSFGKRALT
ncbi:unnamed protein product [Polarella glacialis]|uniref:Protochlorophyllide reductase n=1 Tax=Polarella glacialis TaxID=89957 RepID=A0A813F337_POLGL|nr:unnamed protein product [Polarella glacialis]CAE8688686.1 unnamed protein product [Polarella glacialis]